jgi:hypothetical protein
VILALGKLSGAISAAATNGTRKLGFIEYDGEIKVNKSLLTVVLHE